MKISITLTKRETNSIISIANRYAPIDAPVTNLKDEDKSFKWGRATSKVADGAATITFGMKEDFTIDVLQASDELVQPIMAFAKAVKGMFSSFKAKLEKWEDTPAEVLRKDAEEMLNREAEHHTTFILFIDRVDEWIEVKPGIKKLMPVTRSRLILSEDEIDYYVNKAVDAGAPWVFGTYADGVGTITDEDGAAKFFEDHKACW